MVHCDYHCLSEEEGKGGRTASVGPSKPSMDLSGTDTFEEEYHRADKLFTLHFFSFCRLKRDRDRARMGECFAICFLPTRVPVTRAACKPFPRTEAGANIR